jgi:hypothetical protein
LHEEIALLAAHTDEVLGRWAAVMLNADGLIVGMNQPRY